RTARGAHVPRCGPRPLRTTFRWARYRSRGFDRGIRPRLRPLLHRWLARLAPGDGSCSSRRSKLETAGTGKLRARNCRRRLETGRIALAAWAAPADYRRACKQTAPRAAAHEFRAWGLGIWEDKQHRPR